MSYEPIPQPAIQRLPQLQHAFSWYTRPQHARRNAVKASFQRCWAAYKEHAWMADELMPLAGRGKNNFGGWAATLVDSLDTLWIMGMKAEFAEAVDAAVAINFTTSEAKDTISVFETTIRYLGGLLAAYDLSDDTRLLDKAVELGDTLYGAFDTPNRMPITHWDMQAAANGKEQNADFQALVADIGSLTLEFARLSQITQNVKYYDAVARIMDVFAAQQNETNLPGMWPYAVNARNLDFHTGSEFSVGAMSDSLYEYLVKMHVLLGGSELYEGMYKASINAIVEHALFRPMIPDEADILMAGKVRALEPGQLLQKPDVEHLGCFAGGMLALGGRLLSDTTHIHLARQLTDGCIWAYKASPLGIMPEDFSMVGCTNSSSCAWNETLWKEATRERRLASSWVLPDTPDTDHEQLPLGFTSVTNKKYGLRPEAIESVFILYRITGDASLQDAAWTMFQNIQNATQTDLANAAVSNVLDPTATKVDEMESFWLAETLKYFYLIFSEPSLVSLDDYVFNTEAHPLRRRKRGFWK